MPKKLDAVPATTRSKSVDDPVFRRIEAAQYLGCSVPHYDRIIRDPNGPRIFKFGRNVCTRRSWLNEYVDRISDDKAA